LTLLPDPPATTIPYAGDAARNAQVQSVDGETVDLFTLWSGADRGLALVFLRHYGCPFCKEHARHIESRSPELTAAGVSIALIGCGTGDEARAFRDELGLTNDVYNDPDRIAYGAYGLGQAGMSAVLNPRVLAGGIRAASKGYLPRKSSGHPLQLQGQFLIARDGIVKSAARPTTMSDIPPVSDLLADAMSLPWR